MQSKPQARSVKLSATALLTAAVAATTGLLAGVSAQPSRPPYNPHWGDLERAFIVGGRWDETCAGFPACSLMEPFLTRDGRWLFFNSENVGNDTSLHYARTLNDTHFLYIGRIKGEANAPIPHLDAVAALDPTTNELYWISNRGFPDNYHNVMVGKFDFVDGSVPQAIRLQGSIYIQPKLPDDVWIIMDQEIGQSGDLLFYSNARFVSPTGFAPEPAFSNISLATIDRQTGQAIADPNGPALLATVNSYETPTRNASAALKYAPSSYGADALELMFTANVDDTQRDTLGNLHPVVSGIFVVNRTSRSQPFGAPTQLRIPINGKNDKNMPQWYSEPEAVTYSPDGTRVYFTRIDCCVSCMGDEGQEGQVVQVQVPEEEEGGKAGSPITRCWYALWTMKRL